ncbi:hypothetical protein PsYK624_163700 [Phanerochaete sordida]|uniref:BTB domain-containing protein n=1 Tax=Phanerochaete sordida TaxID=48140 RepID=A0A9P3LM63_9APHY|nr:hypothetical protein PsYK624_163700 [Phanerochaete sordida]
MTRRSQAQADIDDDAREGKRQKMEEEEVEVSASAPRAAGPVMQAFEPRHPDLWYRDGNVIVAADGMSFKVHAGILEKHSTVFRELLDDTRPREQPLGVFEGCSVLRVDDHGEDLAEVLQVLYDGGSGGFFDWKKPIEFPHLRKVTLVAIKYNVQHVIREVIARLGYMFPSSFEPSRLKLHHYENAQPWHPVRFSHVGEASTVVVLARAINQEEPPAFIFMALYHCLGMKADVLRHPDHQDEGWSLSHEDFVRCMLATDSLVAKCSTVRGCVVDALQKPLCSNESCRSGVQRLVCDWIQRGMFSDFDVLRSCDHELRKQAKKHPVHKLCKGCEKTFIRAIDAERREVFADLGKTFDIPNWPAAQVQPQPSA